MNRAARHLFSCLLALLLGERASVAEGIRDTGNYIAASDALSAEEQQTKFHLPAGFAIQLVAAEPQIGKPINLNFDGRGRLYVTCSQEYPLPATERAARRDRIVRLADIGPDGRAATSETALDGLNIPIGVAPLPQELVYFSIPNIFAATATPQGDTYDVSRKLFGPFDYADTHGMASSFTPWLDGWIYGCHGFGNESTIASGDGAPVRLSSGCTFRFRPDGTRFERFTQGQVNPFGMTFNERGDLFAADCSTKPLYTLLRGAWYPNYSRPHDGLGFGPEMMRHSHGSTGIAGVAICSGDYFPDELQGTAFIGNPVTGHVNHDLLETQGSTYYARARDDFLTCDDPWFRPVDLKLGPDGALYIADFYNCIIGHDEVPFSHPRRDHTRGRIWRVVRTDADGQPAPPKPLPDITNLPADRLIELLGNANQTLRVLCSLQLGSRPSADAAAGLRAAMNAADDDPSTALRKAHALWLVEHAAPAGLDAELVERLAADASPLVRVHLLKLLAERAAWSDARLFPLVRGKLQDLDPFVQRAAADALGAHPRSENVAPLLELWGAAPPADRNLVHVARMALRDHLLQPGMYAAMAAHIDNDAPHAARIAEISLGVHTSASAEYLWHYADTHDLDDSRLYEYLHEAVRFAAEDQLPLIFAQISEKADGPQSRQQAALTGMVRAARERAYPLPQPVDEWGRKLTSDLLASSDERAVKQGIELAAELRSPSAFERLAELARPRKKLARLRPAAIAACPAVDPDRAIPLLAAILADPAEAIDVRQKAATALAGMKQEAARTALLERLRTAPEDLAVVIARHLTPDLSGGEALLAEVAAGRVTRQLLNDFVVQSELSRLPTLAAQLAELTADLPSFDVRLQKLIRNRRKGIKSAKIDQEAGHQVFLKVCAACHQLSGQGARIGPPLDGVGLRGLDRLLEDTLDPSRNVDPTFRTMIVVDDGKILTGLLLRREGQLMVLANSEGREIAVPADAEQSMSNISPMPANVGELIPEADYYNLIGFLLEQQQKPAAR